mgnify:CR=1 FL=1
MTRPWVPSLTAVSRPMHVTQISRLALSSVLLATLAGCATQHQRAPVEQRVVRSADGSLTPVRLPPGHENAGKPGYYTVKPGDTLIRISLETGQNWRDISAWNQLDNPNVIEVGQVLRVEPPADTAVAVVPGTAAKPIAAPQIESRGLEQPRPVAAASAPSAPAAAKPAPGGAVPPVVAPAAPAAPKASPSAEDSMWSWPATGPLLGGFDEGRRKGLSIGGKAGDPVMAAAAGQVVYAGSGLRGYGNLVIIKHTGDFLTAYAHNQKLLVKEDQWVRRGQTIAEMGSSDSDRVQLHFELRKQGKPIDPATELPAR